MARAIKSSPKDVGKKSWQNTDYGEIKKVDSDVLASVQAHLLNKFNTPTTRRRDVIHPSEMAKANWCPRQTFLRIRDNKTEAEKFNFQLQSIFEEGNLIHRKWQTWFWEMGTLWGNWKCWCERAPWEAISPRACPRCNSVNGLSYAEIPLTAEKTHLIAGHADGALVRPSTLLEVKSMSKGTVRVENPRLYEKHTVTTTEGNEVVDIDEMWKDLTRPFPSHLRQGQLYLWMCAQMKYDFDNVTFIYENKATQAVKMFNVNYDYSVVEPLLSHALDIRDAVINQRYPNFVPCTCKANGPCKKGNDDAKNSAHEESDSSTRRPLGRSTTEARKPRTDSSGQAEESDPRDSGRTPNRTIGRSINDPVRETGRVGVVHRDAASDSRSGRTIRRRGSE